NVVCSGIVSTNDWQMQSDLTIYPNPASGSFTIELSSDFKLQLTIEIWDLTGTLIQSIRYDETITRISEKLSPGIYFVNARTADSQDSFHAKLIVQ
ncbi:MAG: T9SS type A sorting domain-containing protein, partial [Bacteroidales bacterium]|nr:T9SS type A sorting domain-containing protein [Bacteroidales bacterium]